MAKKEKDEIQGVGLMKKELRALIAETLRTCAELFVQEHGGRGSGKTYTSQLVVIEDCLANDWEFILTVPTQKQQEKGALRKWTSKVLSEQFPKWQTRTTFDYLYMRQGEGEDWRRVGQCKALSMAEQDKIDSDVHRVHYMIWDESMRVDMDIGTADMLIELFLFLYHTVDRDENRVKAIFLGNALNKLDPLYEFFNVTIQDLRKPGIVKRSYNKLSWYVPVPPDVEEQADNKFRKMVKGTKYGDSAAGRFDMSYGFLIGDPGEQPVSQCYGIEFTPDGYLLIMLSERTVYIQACDKAFALKYAQRVYTVSYKAATPEIPCAPAALLNMIRLALAAGRCRFVDEESLLTAAARLSVCYNIKVLGA